MLGDTLKVYDANGKVCALTTTYECFGIIVNTELLEKAGYSRDYITDFDTLKEVAEDVHSRSYQLGFDAFSSSGMDDASSWRITGHLINVAYYWESVDNPQAWVICPSEIKGTYMGNFKQLYDLIVVNSATNRRDLANGGFDAAQEFYSDKALFYLGGNWDWSYLEAMGMKAENLTMIPYYSGVSGEENVGLNVVPTCYWCVNANASRADQKATLDFLYWLVTDTEASTIAVGAFGVMPFESAQDPANPFLQQSNAYLSEGRENMWMQSLYQPNVEAYRATAVSALNAYNANPTDANWDMVVTAFVDGWAVQYSAAYD